MLVFSFGCKTLAFIFIKKWPKSLLIIIAGTPYYTNISTKGKKFLSHRLRQLFEKWRICFWGGAIFLAGTVADTRLVLYS
jgi:hypothetical protein